MNDGSYSPVDYGIWDPRRGEERSSAFPATIASFRTPKSRYMLSRAFCSCCSNLATTSACQLAGARDALLLLSLAPVDSPRRVSCVILRTQERCCGLRSTSAYEGR